MLFNNNRTLSTYLYSAAINHFVNFNVQGDLKYCIFSCIFYRPLNCLINQIEVFNYGVKYKIYNPKVPEESDNWVFK